MEDLRHRRRLNSERIMINMTEMSFPENKRVED